MSASPTVNGLRLLAATITEPLVGAWIADIQHDGTEALEGVVTISLDGETWIGTARSSKPEAGRVKSRIVGGSDGLAVELAARSYRHNGLTLGDVLGDLLREAGETLSSTADAPNTAIALWVRAIGTAGDAIKAVAAKSGQSWRILRDGTLWIGTEAWAEYVPAKDPIEIDTDWSDGNVELRDAAGYRPGYAYQGHEIRQSVHDYQGSGTRTTLSSESSSGTFDRILNIVRREVDYRAVWPGTVKAQNADGTLLVLCDDTRISGTGIDGVPIAPGLPGVTLEVPTDARCYLEFAGGDPSRPRVCGWDHATTLKLAKLTAATSIELSTALVKLAAASDWVALASKVGSELSKVQSELSSIATALTTHVHAGVTTGPGVTGVAAPVYVPAYVPASTAATAVKAS